jgi:hypothetical protein
MQRPRADGRVPDHLLDGCRVLLLHPCQQFLSGHGDPVTPAITAPRHACHRANQDEVLAVLGSHELRYGARSAAAAG